MFDDTSMLLYIYNMLSFSSSFLTRTVLKGLYNCMNSLKICTCCLYVKFYTYLLVDFINFI